VSAPEDGSVSSKHVVEECRQNRNKIKNVAFRTVITITFIFFLLFFLDAAAQGGLWPPYDIRVS
jgi:hypothetical protein